MRVADILKTKTNTEVFSVRASEPVSAVVRQLREHGVGAIVVVDDQQGVIGIISERDVVAGLAGKGGEVLSLRVEELMSKPIYVCKPSDDLKDVMGWMTNYRIRHLPVVEGGRLRGMVSIGDVVKHRLSEVQTEANVLRDIILAR